MHSASDDRKTAARIRDEAMRLFAERGVAGTTLRAIASAAGVSAPLVVHHFGSKDGLKRAVDAHADAVMAELFGLADDPGVLRGEYDNAAAVLIATMERAPAMLGYLRRLLVDGGAQADELFRRLYEMTVAKLAELAGNGIVRPGADDAIRAAFLLANDLGALLLRDQIRAVVGIDPMTNTGVGRWSATVMDVYSHGVMRAPATDEPEEEPNA